MEKMDVEMTDDSMQDAGQTEEEKFASRSKLQFRCYRPRDPRLKGNLREQPQLPSRIVDDLIHDEFVKPLMSDPRWLELVGKSETHDDDEDNDDEGEEEKKPVTKNEIAPKAFVADLKNRYEKTTSELDVEFKNSLQRMKMKGLLNFDDDSD